MKRCLVLSLLAAAVGTAPVAAQQTAATQIGIEELRSNPSKYTGQTVTITGEVQEILGPRLISVSQDTIFDLFDQKVFVHVPNAVALAVREDQEVIVTGTFQTFTGVNLEEEMGWFEPEPDVEAEFNKQYLIMANVIASTDVEDVAVVWNIDRTTGVLVPVMRAGEPATGAAAGAKPAAARAPEITTQTELVGDEAENFVGRQVNLQAPVGKMIGDRSFTVGTGENQTLVLVGEPIAAKGDWKQNVNAGSQVQISGLVLQMPDELPLPMSGLTADERRMIRKQDVYIYATRISTTK